MAPKPFVFQHCHFKQHKKKQLFFCMRMTLESIGELGDLCLPQSLGIRARGGRIMYLAPECITCGTFNVTAGLFGHFGWAWTARECCANGARRVTAAEARARCSPFVNPHGCSG